MNAKLKDNIYVASDHLHILCKNGLDTEHTSPLSYARWIARQWCTANPNIQREQRTPQTDMNSCRPLTHLPTLSKLFEKLLTKAYVNELYYYLN